ncbi:SusC/RagA family TonB-linked outer membrane protein [Mariniphaga sediminis]|uniref:SusC/RagA family TonB-linked outer membrane protein n=2 Tax=Mariniphaga sediminis TaxID=1628158 RepID=A0A399D5H4_9BACT|nr:SusC/RagA family TonB-linked outer membrane protein [Mariniphaga sediminis]
MKKRRITGFPRMGVLKKFYRIMRLTVFFSFLLVFHAVGFNTYSQSTKLNVKLKNTSLKEIFEEIEKQSEFVFLYNYDVLSKQNFKSVSFTNASIEEILNKVLNEEKIEYLIRDRQVIIKEKVNIKPEEIPEIQEQKKIEISGQVTDQNGEPIPGVSVYLKGTTIGIVTDVNGQYQLSLPENSRTLVFSFVGMSTQEVEIGNRTVINIQLSEDVASLEEVVVTALGIEKNKRTLTYATQQVDVDAVTTVKDISLGNMLAGKLAGVAVTTGSGAGGVGSGSRVIIRGERSISGGNTPLIIVDGVPSNFGLDGINPDDVEKINVLKGPSASALYGSAAANGVIIVTTKKGEKGKTQVQVNSLTSFDVPYLYPEFQNEYAQGNSGMYNANEETSSWGPKMEGQTVTDWRENEVPLDAQPNNIKDFFRTGYNLTNSLSYSMGNEKSTAYFSYTNVTAGGLIPVNEMERHNFNLRMDAELIENLKLDCILTWQKGMNENGPVTGDDLFSPMWQLIKMPRSIRTSDISEASYIDEFLSRKQLTWAPSSTGVINPYWSIYGREAVKKSSYLNAVAALKYDITPWLYIQGRGQMANNSENEEEKLYWDTQYVASGKGKYYRKYINSQKLNADFLLGFNKELVDDLQITANLGAEIRDSRSEWLESETMEGLVIENKFYLENGVKTKTKDYENHTQTQSVYGTVQLGFRNYLFLDVTARNDWNSTLPAPHDYFYPSVGLTGVISDIIPLPEIISFAKLRGSYAEVGNGASFASIYQTFSRESNGTMGIVKPNSGKVPSELIPERTKAWEAGAEMRLLKDRFGIDFTWYKSNTYNQLVFVTSPPSSGYSSAGINCGNIQNKGIEVMLTTVPIQVKNLKWDLSLNFSRNWNKVIELTSTLDRYRISAPDLSVGNSWIIVGRPYGEILSKGFVRNEEGQVIVDELGYPEITADSEIYLGNFNYDWRSSLNNNIRYKNWNLYFLIDLNYGGVRQSATEAQMMGSGTSIATLYGRDGFVFDGVKRVIAEDESVSYVPNDIEITAEQYGKHIGGRATSGAGEAFNHEATNSRLRELSIGYTLPVKSAVIKDITVSAIGRNLFYIYNACKWFDPDITYDLEKNGQGSESAFLPGARNVGFNIKLSL